MIDYIVYYKLKGVTYDTVLIIEDDIDIEDDFEKEEVVRGILLEILKDDFGKDVELVDCKTVNMQCNLYRFADEDVYYDN